MGLMETAACEKRPPGMDRMSNLDVTANKLQFVFVFRC